MPFQRKKIAMEHRKEAKSFLESWGPPIVTGMIAFIASMVLAYYDAESAEKKMYMELRIKHADQTTKYLESYVAAWDRMIAKCKIRDQQVAEDNAANARLTPEQKSANEAIEKKREEELEQIAKTQLIPSGDALWGEFAALNLYFSSDLVEKLEEFRKFDDKLRHAECNKLPDSNEGWRKFQSKIISQLRLELDSGGLKHAKTKE